MFARWLRGCLSQIRSWLIAPFRPRPSASAAKEATRPSSERRSVARPSRKGARKPVVPVVRPIAADAPAPAGTIAPPAVEAAEAAFEPEPEPELLADVPAGPVRWSYCEACGHVYRVGAPRAPRSGARRARRGCDRPRVPPSAPPRAAATAMSH